MISFSSGWLGAMENLAWRLDRLVLLAMMILIDDSMAG
jgi:hypothetical protein